MKLNKTDGTIILENVRLSWPCLATPRASDEGGTPKFEASFHLDKAAQTDDIVKLLDHVVGAYRAKVGKNPPPAMLCLKDGAQSGRDELEGVWVYKASSKRQPILIGRDGIQITSALDIENHFYAGCYVDAMVLPWVQDNAFGKRVNSFVNALRWRADGERLGGGGGPSLRDVAAAFGIAVNSLESVANIPAGQSEEEQSYSAFMGKAPAPKAPTNLDKSLPWQ